MKRGFGMRNDLGVDWIAVAILLFAACAAAISYAQWSNPADEIPAYHSSAPLKITSLPPILSGAKLTGENFRYPWQVRLSKMQQRFLGVLYQLPCNCRCDRALGAYQPSQLFSKACTERNAQLAQKKGLLLTEQTKLGKTPGQIRAAIAHQEYESVSLWKVSRADFRSRLPRKFSAQSGVQYVTCSLSLTARLTSFTQSGGVTVSTGLQAAERHAGGWAPVIAYKNTIANNNLALAA